MNIFFLDKMPKSSAMAHCDGHVRSGIIESVTMMGLAYDDGDFTIGKWLRHSNPHYWHPMSKWVRSSRQNFDYTLQYGYALIEEFTYRFGKGHKCSIYMDWIAANLPLDNLPNIGATEPPRCFGNFKDEVDISEDIVYDYRRYFMVAKRHLAKWTKRETPYWYR